MLANNLCYKFENLGHFLIDCVAVRRRLAGCSASSGSSPGDLPAAGQTFSHLNFFSPTTLSSRWAETPLSGWCPPSTRTPWFSFHRKKSSTRSASTTAAATGSVAKVCFSFFRLNNFLVKVSVSVLLAGLVLIVVSLCQRYALHRDQPHLLPSLLEYQQELFFSGSFCTFLLRKGSQRKRMFFFRLCSNSPPLPQFGQVCSLFLKRQKHWHKQHFKAKTT